MANRLDFVGRDSGAVRVPGLLGQVPRAQRGGHRGPCYCREGISHWLDELQRCPDCGGGLVDGPWAGDELVFGEIPGVEHDDYDTDYDLRAIAEDVGDAGTVLLDEAIAVDDEWMIVLSDEGQELAEAG